MAQTPTNGNNGLATATHFHYLVVYQTAIAKELGVSQRTISNWLSPNGGDTKEAIIAKVGNVSNNGLSVRTIPQAMARALGQEGLSKTAIAKELGVSKGTISGWLKQKPNYGTSAISEQQSNSFKTCTSGRMAPHYLVVCDAVEKFRPPDGGERGCPYIFTSRG